MSSFESRPFTPRPAHAFIGRAEAAAPTFVENPPARRQAREDGGDPEATAPLVAEPTGDDAFDRRIAEAHARGRAEGALDAAARSAAEMRRALDALTAGIADSRAREARAVEELAQRALSLAAEIAERVLRRSLTEDLELLAPCVTEALSVLAPESPATLALAPDDLAQLRAGGAPALARLAERTGIELREDAALARGEAALAAGPACVELRWSVVTARLRAVLEAQLFAEETGA